MTTFYMCDASAVLACINEEHGGQKLTEILNDNPDAVGYITAANASEVIQKLLSVGLTTQEAHEALSSLELNYVPIDEELAVNAADLWHVTKSHGLSMGDRFCLAAAQKIQAYVLTTDKVWSLLNIAGLKIISLR